MGTGSVFMLRKSKIRYLQIAVPVPAASHFYPLAVLWFFVFFSSLPVAAAIVRSFSPKRFHVSGNFLWFASCDFPTSQARDNVWKKGQFLRNIMKGADFEKSFSVVAVNHLQLHFL